jgi:hypothetical protein
MSFQMDVKYGVNTVYNPTGFEIEGACEGVNYRIKPFSTNVLLNDKEVGGIFDIWHVNHLLQTCKRLGLVSLEYGPKARAKFHTFEEYRSHQEISGLKQRLDYQRELIRRQEAALKQMKEKGATVDVSFSKIKDKLVAREKVVTEWLKDAGMKVDEINDKEKFEKRPEWRNKGETKKQ